MKKLTRKHKTAGLILKLIAVIAFTFSALMLCDIANTPDVKVEQTNEVDKLREGFRAGCLSEDLNMPYCDCVFDGLYKEFDYQGIREMGIRELKGEEMTREEINIMYNIAVSCGHLL